jgi:acyl carrier protein
MENLLSQIFRDDLGFYDEEFSTELTYNSSPKWDSASHLILIMALEERLGVSFSPDEVVSMTSVRKILELIHKEDVN